jgi:hypothetical protein
VWGPLCRLNLGAAALMFELIVGVGAAHERFVFFTQFSVEFYLETTVV